MFTWDSLAPANPALAQVFTEREPGRVHRVLPVVDDGLLAAWGDLPAALRAYFAAQEGRVIQVADPIPVPGGESAKNDPAVIAQLQATFHAHRMDRHSFVLVIGGGGVLDAVGYAAATTHRGVRLVRMPTTVLGQDDSGVGVKNGINAFGAKNFIGTFAPPYAVVNDFRFLETLPRRERIAGMAEAVKVALIRDPDFFGWLEENAPLLAGGDLEALAALIERCAELHLRHIGSGGDPFEHGSARPLDFGHWSAHKLEALTAHTLRHGEAVAIGLLLDSRYSYEAGMLPAPELERIHRLIRTLGLPRWHDALDHRGPSGDRLVLAGLEEFREHLGGELTVTLLRGLGRGVEVNAMDPALIERAIAWTRSAAQS